MNHLITGLSCAIGSFIGFSLGMWAWQARLEKQHQRRLAEMREQLKQNYDNYPPV